MAETRHSAPSLTITNGRTDDDEIGHLYCGRRDDLGLCGASLTGPEDPDSLTCVVCLDLERINDFCPRGGRCDC